MSGIVETLCIRLTRKCNLQCPYCWAGSSLIETDSLSPDIVISFCRRIAAVGLKHVSLSGGEPALYPNIANIVENLLNSGLSVSVTTNGAIEPGITMLLAHVESEFKNRLCIRVSVDGGKRTHERLRGHGTFDLALAELANSRGQSWITAVNTTALGEPTDLAQLCSELTALGIKKWALMTPLPRGRAETMPFDPLSILRLIASWKEIIASSEYEGELTIWDFISHPNGSVLVEANGDVLLPGINKASDILVGTINDITPALLEEAVMRRLNKDPIAFFSAS